MSNKNLPCLSPHWDSSSKISHVTLPSVYECHCIPNAYVTSRVWVLYAGAIRNKLEKGWGQFKRRKLCELIEFHVQKSCNPSE
jgi:hypothetical protein